MTILDPRDTNLGSGFGASLGGDALAEPILSPLETILFQKIESIEELLMEVIEKLDNLSLTRGDDLDDFME